MDDETDISGGRVLRGVTTTSCHLESAAAHRCLNEIVKLVQAALKETSSDQQAGKQPEDKTEGEPASAGSLAPCSFKRQAHLCLHVKLVCDNTRASTSDATAQTGPNVEQGELPQEADKEQAFKNMTPFVMKGPWVGL